MTPWGCYVRFYNTLGVISSYMTPWGCYVRFYNTLGASQYEGQCLKLLHWTSEHEYAAPRIDGIEEGVSRPLHRDTPAIMKVWSIMRLTLPALFLYTPTL